MRSGRWRGSLEVERLEGGKLRQAGTQQLHGVSVDAVATAARFISITAPHRRVKVRF